MGQCNVKSEVSFSTTDIIHVHTVKSKENIVKIMGKKGESCFPNDYGKVGKVKKYC